MLSTIAVHTARFIEKHHRGKLVRGPVLLPILCGAAAAALATILALTGAFNAVVPDWRPELIATATLIGCMGGEAIRYLYAAGVRESFHRITALLEHQGDTETLGAPNPPEGP